MANLRITLQTARRYGAQSGEIYTEKDGTRWTHDTLGNPIIISPTEVIESPDGPDSPLAIPKEEARGYTYEGSLRKPKSTTFKDVGGKEVTLTGTDIRPYLFDPTLIQRESDSALISGKTGPDVPPIGTELKLGGDWEQRRFGYDKEDPRMERATFQDPWNRAGELKAGEGGYTRLMPGAEGGEERVSEEETQKIKEASERIDRAVGIVPPGGPELPEEGGHDYERPGDRDDYRAFIVQKMGGDPTKINPHEEVMKMFSQDRVQQWYEDEWKQGQKTWYDMSVNEQEQVGAAARSDLLAQLIKELGFKEAGLNAAMAEYDKNASAFFRALKVIRGAAATEKKEIRARAKEEETALYRLNRAQKDKVDIEKQIAESFDEKEKTNLQNRLKTVEEEIRHHKTLADLEKPKPKTGGKEKPISTAPAWAGKFVADKKIDPKNYVRSTTDEHGKYVEVMEDGKKVRYGLENGKTEWVKMTPGKQKLSSKEAAVAGAKGVGVIE